MNTQSGTDTEKWMKQKVIRQIEIIHFQPPLIFFAKTLKLIKS